MLFPKKQINGEKEPQQQIGKDGLNGSEEEAGLVFRRGHFASERNWIAQNMLTSIVINIIIDEYWWFMMILY